MRRHSKESYSEVGEGRGGGGEYKREKNRNQWLRGRFSNSGMINIFVFLHKEAQQDVPFIRFGLTGRRLVLLLLNDYMITRFIMYFLAAHCLPSWSFVGRFTNSNIAFKVVPLCAMSSHWCLV